MQSPSIGVCIVFCNKVDQTIECIQSFLGSGVNIYLYNNGSEENERKILGNFCENKNQIKIIDSKENIGPGRARNALIEESFEDWLVFADNDIVVKESYWLDNLLNHISHTKNSVGIFLPRLYHVHEGRYSRETVCKINKDGSVDFETSKSSFTNMFPGGASIIRRELIKRVGGYDPKIFVGFEEFEIAIRAIKDNKPIVCEFIYDIEFIHNHRYSENKADKDYLKTRYSYDHISFARNYIKEKHGVILDGEFKPWLEEQIMQQATNPNPSIIKKILGRIRNFLKL